MKLGEERARGSLRFSFGRFNSEADVNRVIEIVPKVIAKLRALSSSSATKPQGVFQPA